MSLVRLRTLALATWVAALSPTGYSTPNTRIVTVNIVAVDPRGDVADLRREDLRVNEAGEKRNIVFLRRIGSEPWNPPPLSPSEVSNRGGAFAPYATVILLDLFNEEFAAQANASARLAHDLQSIQNPDSLFLYVVDVDGQAVPVHGIPFDLHFHYRNPSSEPPWTGNSKSLIDEALMKGGGSRRPSIPISEHVTRTFQALDSIGVTLSRIPGRKNIIWINNGVPVIIHPVARSGLRRPASYAYELKVVRERFNTFGVALYSLRPPLLTDSLLSREGEAALDRLVEDTGGRLSEGVEIGDAVRQAMRDASTSYQLGYEQPVPVPGGRIHMQKLRVATSRKGVRIQAGYPSGGEDFSQMMDAAATPPFDTAEIGLHGVLARDPQNARLAHLRILINSRDLALIHENQRYRGVLRLAVVGYVQSNRTTETPVVPFEVVFHHGEEDHQKVLDTGIQFTQDVTLGERVTKIRLIVLDQTSSTMGTLTFPVSAPPD